MEALEAYCKEIAILRILPLQAAPSRRGAGWNEIHDPPRVRRRGSRPALWRFSFNERRTRSSPVLYLAQGRRAPGLPGLASEAFLDELTERIMSRLSSLYDRDSGRGEAR